MCPNKGKPDTICPGIPHTPHPEPSPCDFIKTYLDENGSKVFVSTGLWNAGKTFMSFRSKSPSAGMHRVKSKFLPERRDFDKAQADLDEYAEKKEWKEEGK
jgi:hypothetical protein